MNFHSSILEIICMNLTSYIPYASLGKVGLQYGSRAYLSRIQEMQRVITMFTVTEMLCSSAQDPKDVVRKGMLSSLPWEPCARWRESNSFSAFMALASHHSCSGHRGLQQGWEAGGLPHSRYKVPPTFAPNTPSLPLFHP